MPHSSVDALVASAHESLTTLLARTDAAPAASLGDAYYGRAAKDVLTHLHGWHVLFLGWVADAGAGRTPLLPAPGHSWENLVALNDELYETYRPLTYDQARAALVDSHEAMVEAVGVLDDLFTPDAYGWAPGETLGEVAHECLGAHYAWAHRTLDQAEEAE